MKYTYFIFTIVLFGLNSSLFSQSYLGDFKEIVELASTDDITFFTASDEPHGLELWRTNGTKEGTSLIKDINTIRGSIPKNLTVFNGELYFSANDGSGEELWKSNGTESGTIMVKDIQVLGGSRPNTFEVFNNELYFLASGNIWKTDGTESGTVLVFDSVVTTFSNLIATDSKLYVVMYGLLHEVNISTGIPEAIYIDDYDEQDRFAVIDNELYFITRTRNNRFSRLYRMGNDNVPIMLGEYSSTHNNSVVVRNIKKAGNKIFFSVSAENDGLYSSKDALWVTDGTLLGTEEIRFFYWNQVFSGSNISNFIEYNNELYFNSGRTNDFALWKSDGTTLGTTEVTDVAVNNLTKLRVHNDRLYFSNRDKLWYTDGTHENTKKFSDLIISNLYSPLTDDFFNLKASENNIFFEAKSENSRTLYSVKKAPLLEVEKGDIQLEIKDKIYFETKISSVSKMRLTIKNVGNEDLHFSKIEVLGEDFYLNGEQASNISNENPNGNFPQIIKPHEQKDLDVIFYPNSKGTKKGTLKILSDYIQYPLFDLDIVGFAEDEIGQSPSGSINLNKEIVFDYSNKNIVIDNNEIDENVEANSLVGSISIQNSTGNYTFSIMTGNENFVLNSNELKNLAVFDFESKNTYDVRIRATNTITSEIIEDNIVISVLDVVEEDLTENCSLEINSLVNGLNDVQYIDEFNVIAVGYNGTILKSNDGGDSWIKIRSERGQHLYKLQFASEKIGYAIGEIMLKTDDAGESWYPIDVSHRPVGNRLRGLFFINPNIGFVFDDDKNIYKTIDGGSYWKLYTHDNGDFNSIFFLNETEGYISRNAKRLVKTIDGGETWENINVEIPELGSDTKFTNILFVNNETGFLTTDDGEFVKTTNGGDSWSYVSELEYNINISDVDFYDENNGNLVTSSFIYETSDGGATWNRGNPNLSQYLRASAINSTGVKSLAVGHGNSCCEGGTVIYKKEAANDWEIISYLNSSSTEFNAVYFDDNKGMAFSSGGSAKTYDGGATWQRILPPEDYIFQVEVFNNIVYIIGRSTFYKSSDFGESWEVINSGINLDRFEIINEQIIVGIKDSGFVKSVDGGVNWTSYDLEYLGAYNLHFLSENKGYVSGDRGIFKTVDGGETFNQVVLEPLLGGEQPFVYVIHFFDQNIGMAGSSVGLLKSTDGGLTWERLNENFGGQVKFVHANGELDWLVVAKERMFRTIDGGESWTLEYYDEEVEDAHFTSEKAYLVGDRSIVEIKTQSSPIVGHIDGPKIVGIETKEVYSVIKESNVEYRWSVSGTNKIIYRDNIAEILWNSLGEHLITITPYKNCIAGIPKQIMIEVKDVIETPVHTGSMDVFAYPNPASTKLEIIFPNLLEEQVNVELYNVQFQLISVFEKTIINNRISLAIDDVATGLYFVKLNLDKPVILRIVKK